MPFPQLRSGNINLLAGLIQTVNGDGAAAITFGAGSSTLTGSGALVGACAVTFGEGSSTLGGSGPLSGSCAVVFDATATGGAPGVLAGSCAITFGAGNSTLGSSGTLAGSAAIVFGAGSSTLGGTGDAAGAAGMLFGEGSSTLIGAGALLGSSAVTFVLTAASAGESAMLGTAAIAFGSGSSTLTGSGALAGSAALTLTPTGTMETAASLAGTVALAFDGSATLIGASAIAGSCAVTVSLTGLAASLTHGECVAPTNVTGATGTVLTYPGGGVLGDDVTWIDEDPDAADAFDSWVELTGVQSLIQVKFAQPDGTLQTGVNGQRFRALIQRATAVTTGWRIDLRENGVFRAILATGSLTDNNSVVVTGSWNAASLVTDPTGGAVNLRLIQTTSGTTLKIGALEWCQLLEGVEAPTLVGVWSQVVHAHAGGGRISAMAGGGRIEARA